LTLSRWPGWPGILIGSVFVGVPRVALKALVAPKPASLEVNVSGPFIEADWLPPHPHAMPSTAGCASLGPKGVLLHGYKRRRDGRPSEEMAFETEGWTRVDVSPEDRTSMIYTRQWTLRVPIDEGGRDLILAPEGGGSPDDIGGKVA
jgi:hypothetical protein